MSLNIDHLSHSAITQFVNCPTSWASRYALGLRSARGEAANFGTYFESLIAHGMGFKEALTEYQDDGGKRLKCTEEEYRARFISPEIDRAAQHYQRQKFAWKAAHDYQRPVELTPVRWEGLAGEYGADPELPIRLIGFLDFTRQTPESASLPDALRPYEILDIKTISSDTWKSEWGTQGVLYCLAIGATRFTIHRYVRGLPHKLAAVTIDLTTPTGKTLVKQVMDRTAYYVKQIAGINKNPGLLEGLPRNPGFHCGYCALKDECVSGNPFDSFGRKQWAKGDEGTTGETAADVGGILGGLV